MSQPPDPLFHWRLDQRRHYQRVQRRRFLVSCLLSFTFGVTCAWGFDYALTPGEGESVATAPSFDQPTSAFEVERFATQD